MGKCPHCKKEIVDLSNNPNRKRIIDIIKKYPDITISEVQRKIGLTAANTFNHIKTLRRLGVIKGTRHYDKSSRIVTLRYVSNHNVLMI